MTNSFSKLFKYIAISLLFSLSGFIFGQLFIPANIASMGSLFLGLFFTITFIVSLLLKKHKSSFISMNKVYTFAFIHGICIYPVINYYAYSLGTSTVLGTFIGTIIVFLSLSVYAKNNNTEKVLTIGPMLNFILLAILVVNIINIFAMSKAMNILISSIGILLFSTYIMHSLSIFKHTGNFITLSDADDYAPFVLNLYTDFMNLFMNILKLLDSVDRD